MKSRLSGVVLAGLKAVKDAQLQGVVFDQKSPSDFVSNEDTLADQRMLELARAYYPSIPVFSEESTELPPHLPAAFISIDPLDGSNNRSRRYDAWGITATLVQERVPIESVAYVRLHGRSYFLKAKKGQGFYIREAKRGHYYKKFRIETELPGVRYTVPGSPKQSNIASARVYQEFLTRNNLWKSNIAEGCASANVLSLLFGNTDVYVNPATGNVLDLASMQLMLQEAGGYVVDCKGAYPLWHEPWMPVIFSRNAKIAAPFLMQ